ncbi:MAG: PAS domain S-box protein [Verrucomicrobiota bacterium]|nr:PAS domain S-box protein [Verrucomicrobiota bacterium]
MLPLPRTSRFAPDERDYRQIFDEAPIGMAVVALDEHFLQVNSTLCTMLGYSEEEFADLTMEGMTLVDDVEDGRERARQLMNGLNSYTGEKRLIRKNGEVLWTKRTACMIRGEQGEPRHYLVMVENISERRRSEESLRQNKLELEAALHANQLIMDNSQDVICVIDPSHRFLSMSAASEELFGYAPDEMIGRPYSDFVHPDDLEKTDNAAAHIVIAGRAADFVNRYVRKDGTIVDVLWSVTWSEADQKAFCVAHNTTERARMENALREAKEEADRANHAKSDFLSRMSHELRTPLNAILGFSQLIERQSPTETQRNRVAHIISAGRHLLQLINEVLDISRIEAGKLQMSLEPVCLRDALEDAVSLMRPLAAERAIRITRPNANDENCFLLGDRQRLKQVLLNLLSNALKYTPEGGEVRVTCTPCESGKMRVGISDTGAGIAREKLPRLFVPFDRLGAEQSSVEGTGLGLALCQRLMQAMQGSIGAESEVGTGSNFWIELPCAQSPLAKIAAQTGPRAELRSSASGDKRTILYVEDNLSNLTLIEQLLADESPIELMSAMQGQMGLDLAREHVPDLVLLDLHLPDVPGWDVLAQLKRDPKTRDIPVIVISADATPSQIKRLMAAGAHTYLTKPLDVGEFLRVIEEAMPRSGALAAGEAAEAF